MNNHADTNVPFNDGTGDDEMRPARNLEGVCY